jgi:hypothetical protein
MNLLLKLLKNILLSGSIGKVGIALLEGIPQFKYGFAGTKRLP